MPTKSRFSWRLAVIMIAAALLASSSVFGLPKMRVKWIYNISDIAESGFKWSCPILADLDGDGTQEIIVGTEKGGRLVAVKASGQLMWVFPPLEVEGPRLNKAHAAADIDGDGKMEVLLSAGSPPTGVVYCLNWDGSIRWNWTDPESNFKYGGTIVKDIDGDGVKEIITTGADSKIYVFSNTGELKWVKFLPPGHAIDSVPVAFDVDRDGDVEILAFARCQGSPGTEGAMTGRLYCLSPSGEEEWSWSSSWADCLHAQPSIADVNGDGEYEIIQSLWKLDSGDAGGVVELSFYGTELARKQITRQVAHDPMIWDIDGDGTMDILIGGRDSCYYDLNPDLSEKWKFNFTSVIGQVSKALNEAGGLGDVTGDGKIDVVFQSWQNSTVMILDREGQLEVQPFNLPADATTAVVIGDPDGDGKSDIVACSGTGLYDLTLDAPYDPTTFVWPMLGRNPWHSGVVSMPEVLLAAFPLLALLFVRRR